MYQPSGIAAAVNGFYRGRDEETQRQNSEEDRAYSRTQRQYQGEQQARQRETWGREDTLRKDIAAVPSTREVEVGNAAAMPPLDDEGTPAAAALPAKKTLQVPMDVQLRQQAEAYKKSGDSAKWLEATNKADELGLKRSVQKATELEAMAPGKSTMEIATMAKKIFEEDPFPQKIRSFKDDGAGGVTAEIENTDTGSVVTQTFRTPADIITGLKGLYNPAGFAALQAARQKIAEEANKPQKLSPGQRLVVGGKVIYSAPPPVGAEYIGDDANGDPMYRKMATGGGAGGAPGSAKGGKVDAGPAGEAVSYLHTILKEADTKQPDTVIAAAQDHVNRLMAQNPKLPPAMAARAALAVAKDPKALQPAINPETGKIDMVFDDGANGKIAFNRGVADAVNTNGIPRETLTRLTSGMLQTLQPKEREAMHRAAFDGTARADLEQSLKSQAEQVINEKIAGASPEQAAAVRANVEQALDKRMKSLGNNLNLIYNYGSKPAGTPQRKAPGKVGGLMSAVNYEPPADSPAGRTRAMQGKARGEAEARGAASRAEQSKLSTQFQQDSTTMQPIELVRKYDALRGQLPTQDAAQLQAIEKQIR